MVKPVRVVDDTANAPSSAMFSGIATMSGGSFVLATQSVSKGVALETPSSNSADVYIGDYPLAAGSSVDNLEVDNLSRITVSGSSNDLLYYIGS